MQYNHIKIFKDNYAWILWNDKNEAILIDCGDYKAIKIYLEEHNLSLKYILITHAHADHIDGINELRDLTQAKVLGNKNFPERLPALDIGVEGGQEIEILGCKVKIFNTPGHCADHLSYLFEDDKFLFVGDFLFSLGCGRIFEGEPSVMVTSFNTIKKLPGDILVFPGHEYTKANLAFNQKILGNYFDCGPKAEEIMNSSVTLPSTLEFEFKYNPFLNLDDPVFKARMHHENSDEVTFFKYLRELKNNSTQLLGG